MKYLAILRDSFREAVDGKIIYVMLALAGLLTLLIASISFRPVSVQEEATNFADSLNRWMSFSPQAKGVRYSIEDFAQTNDAAELWNRDYQFGLVIQFPDAEGLDVARKSGIPVDRKVIAPILKQRFYWLDRVEVEEVKTEVPGRVAYQFTSHGSKVDNERAWPHEPSVLFAFAVPVWHTPVTQAVFDIEYNLINIVGSALAILIGVVITSTFVPNMMRKGTIDLLVSKPINRSTLLIYKYVGGLSFMLVLTTATIGGVWLALAVRSGIWSTGFLWTIPILTFYFAILYSVSVLAAVLSRNAIVAILLTCFVWGVFWVNGLVHNRVEAARKAEQTIAEALDGEEDRPRAQGTMPDWLRPFAWISDVGYTTLPRTEDMDNLTAKLIAENLLSKVDLRRKGLDNIAYPSWGATLGVSGAFIAAMLGLACWRFSARDF